MNTARIRRTEKMMTALAPRTRVARYWDAVASGNGQAHRLLQTMPAEQREGFQRVCLATAMVIRLVPETENLLLRVQNHLLACAARPEPMTDLEVDAWLETVRGQWAELLAFEQFRDRAITITGENQPMTVMMNTLAVTRRVLVDLKKGLAPKLKDVEQVGAAPKFAATLVRLLVD